MSDLIKHLEAALDERQRAVEGSGVLGWLTFRNTDGSMQYTTAASTQGDDRRWVIDGREAYGWAQATVVHDEDRELAKVAGARKILPLHSGNHECQQLCGDENINLWVDKDEVCPTVLALAEMFGVDLNEA